MQNLTERTFQIVDITNINEIRLDHSFGNAGSIQLYGRARQLRGLPQSWHTRETRGRVARWAG